jgi:cell division protein FtsA
VIDAAKAVAIPFDREVIHILPQEYIIDDQRGIQNPLGMSGVRLEAKVHIVTGAVTSAQNIVKCCQRAGLDVCDIVLESLASAEAVLNPQERKLGVALVDFGGGTADLAIFSGSSIRHSSVLSLGGNNLTNDIAVGLRTPVEEAEKIKQRYGCALTAMIQKDETIQVPSVGGGKPRVLSRQILGEILEPRVEEVCTLLQRELMRSGYSDLVASGLVITGGTALLPGLADVAEQVFNLPVRTGLPTAIGGLVDVVKNPMYATGVGLVLYGANSKPKKLFRIRQNNIFNRLLDRMRKWFKDVV